MEAFKKIILDEKQNSITEKGVKNTDFSVVTDQTKKFDNSYSASKVRELFNEFDNITVNEKDFKTKTLTQTNVISASKLSFRTKLYVTSAVMVTALLIFLAIYNIFVINSINSSIEILQGDLAVQTTQLDSVYSNYAELSNEEAIKSELQTLGYTASDTSSVVLLNVEKAQTVETLQGETNWFDSICNFISSVFGG